MQSIDLRGLAGRLTVCSMALLPLPAAGPGPGAWRSAVAVPGDSVPRYELTVTLDPDSHRLRARGDVRLPGTIGVRPNIRLLLSESMRDLVVDVIEPRPSRGRAALERKDRPASTPGWGSTVWTVAPRAPFPAREPIVLRFSYAGGEKPGFVFYLGPEGSFAGGVNTAWYPQVLDSADAVSWATGNLTFRVPPGQSVVASGIHHPTTADSGLFAFTVSEPVLFAFAAGKYTVLRRGGAVRTALYLLRPRADGERYLDGAGKILDVLVREYGPHPYGNQFAIVEVPSERLDQAGASGANFEHFVMSSGTSLDAPFNPVFYGHEMGHIWWGNLIKLTGSRGRLMLDEGMAQYSALIALEDLFGAKVAEQFRRHGDPASPIEQSASAYFAMAAGGLDHPLATLPSEWNSRNLADSKGPMVMAMLAQQIGRERFRTILQRFTREHAFRRVTWKQFADAFDQGTNGEFRWFFEQWFNRAGAADWRLHWTQESGVFRGLISQDAPYFGGQVQVDLIDSTGQRIVRHVVVDTASRTEFSVPVRSGVKEAILDPEYRVLRWTPRLRAEAPLLAPYWTAFAQTSANQPDSALRILDSAITRLPSGDTVGARFLLEELRARVMVGEPGRLAEAQARLQRGLLSASRRTERLGWSYYLLGYIASRLKDEATLQLAIEGAEAADAITGGWAGWGPATRRLRQQR
jgi:hypothetical protein